MSMFMQKVIHFDAALWFCVYFRRNGQFFCNEEHYAKKRLKEVYGRDYVLHGYEKQIFQL